MSLPIEAVIAEAKRYLGVMEQPKNSNRGVQIDYWLAETGIAPGAPWCAAFVGQVGRQALGAAWLCPRTASVAAIAAWAAASNRIVTSPQRGDLFLLWSPELKRFAHVGFVTDGGSGKGYDTIEGNTNPGGGREGYGVFRRSRSLVSTTRFVRWEAA